MVANIHILILVHFILLRLFLIIHSFFFFVVILDLNDLVGRGSLGRLKKIAVSYRQLHTNSPHNKHSNTHSPAQSPQPSGQSFWS